MKYQTLELEVLNHVGIIWFNRPEIRNALNDIVLKEIGVALKAMEKDAGVRAVCLAGHGPAFCAGADLNWMKKAASYSKAQNLKDAKAGLADTLYQLHTLTKPTVARIHGPAYAGGMGFVAACDIAVASMDATFCLSETRLGLIPATISPYVVRAMGERMASRYCLTAERFDAAEAYRIGFIHEITPPDELDTKVNEILGYLVQAGPRALAETKKLIALSGGTRLTPAVRAETAKRIAETRASAEGREGIASFLEKRKPKWVTALKLDEA
jgi:methylglutaconyl-CoA hydratase